MLKDTITPDTTAGEATEHDLRGLEFGLSPIDLPEDDERPGDGMRWTLAVLAVSSAMLIVFNSFVIDKWARQLETTETTGPIKDAAARWHGAMQSLYLDVPLETGRSLWRSAKEASFSGDDQPDDPRK